MIYLPDTNAWIAYLNPGNSPVKARFRAHPPANVAFCSMVKAELFYGAYHSSQWEDNLRLLATLFPQFKSVPFDDVAAETYGRLRADLAARGTPIGPNDLMIAAIALVNQLILVTHNTREFARGAGLQLEDWAST
ncbi:MAG: type II toxin-antitoxin system VapC family toxin [Candidatus Competibacteraceae bacterium]